MQIELEQINDKKVTSQYWGFRELTEAELMLIAGGSSDDNDEDDVPEQKLPPITVSGNSESSAPPGYSSGGSQQPPPPVVPPKREHDNCLDGIMSGALGGVLALPVGGPVLALGALLTGVVGGGCFGKDAPGSFRK